MSARVLIVDDLAPNIHLLEVKLAAQYYDVLSAMSGEEALEIAARERLDLILLDAMMPGMNGFETCKRLKSDAKTWHIPVIMVTALEESKDRIRGLEAGADDFITKPIDDFNLMARVKSLLRLKMVTDQLLSHTGHTLENSRPILDHLDTSKGRILLLDDHIRKLEKLGQPLAGSHELVLETDPKTAIKSAAKQIDLIVVSLVSKEFDGLRFCASLRADARTREIPILAIGDPEDQARLIRAYDIGINDTLLRPIEQQELLARVNTQLKRKFYADSLKENFNESLEMVVTDPLTGLGNRRYLETSVAPLFEQFAQSGIPFSLAVFDIDNFKRVNDILGHDTGDMVLKDVAARLASNMRSIDIVSRYGGEEFVIAVPETKAEDAYIALDRIRGLIGGTPFTIDGQAFSVTVSAGLAEVQSADRLSDLFKRADNALYKAKRAGRNQVHIAKPTHKAA
ncbi:MAG TPA: PleD family two-component system response regulator [Hellea balneolensis]|uniref:diguanylate cyclase n=1 Tax=Hellea balneolensis TaxID=287478 RepID=A0A7C5QVY5_9PROT|nr:PleD family two-component system response regulator [Hellea balneolensis]